MKYVTLFYGYYVLQYKCNLARKGEFAMNKIYTGKTKVEDLKDWFKFGFGNKKNGSL